MAKVIDFMSPGLEHPTIFRIVEGVSGAVTMHLELIARFDYGSIAPWAQSTGDGLTLVAGSDALRFHSPVPLHGDDLTTQAEFTVSEGQQRGFSLAGTRRSRIPRSPWTRPPPGASPRSTGPSGSNAAPTEGDWRDDVVRSLITVKALQYEPTGAVCAAATTSLPEQLGGVRNWDYRFSWLRDSSLTLQALVLSGYHEEASAWQHWLQRAVAGNPGDFQIMYGVGGERRLTEVELDWLPGYEDSKPVRIGNEASEQFQLDVFGEIADAALTAVEAGLAGRGAPPRPPPAERRAARRDDGPPREGVAAPRRRHLGDPRAATPLHAVEGDGVGGVRPRREDVRARAVARNSRSRSGAQLADQVKAEVCEKGFNTEKNSFVQYYGSDQLDSSLLMLARVGFLPPTDPRIIGTVEAIQRELMVDGFVLRYPTSDDNGVDGLPAGEGTFLMTTFWLVDNLALIGRRDEALALFEKLRSPAERRRHAVRGVRPDAPSG